MSSFPGSVTTISMLPCIVRKINKNENENEKITSAGVFIPASLAVLPYLTRKSLVKSVAIYPGVQLLTVIFGNLSKFATNQVSG